MRTKLISGQYGVVNERASKPAVPLNKVKLADYLDGLNPVNERLTVTFRKNVLPLNLLITAYTNGTRFLHVDLGYPDSKVALNVAVQPWNGVLQVSSGILKKDDKKRLPKEIGLYCWLLVPGYIQALADITGKRHVHEAEQRLTLSRKPMSEASWKRVFLSHLERLGYVQVSPILWIREYAPAVSSDVTAVFDEYLFVPGPVELLTPA